MYIHMCFSLRKTLTIPAGKQIVDFMGNFSYKQLGIPGSPRLVDFCTRSTPTGTLGWHTGLPILTTLFLRIYVSRNCCFLIMFFAFHGCVCIRIRRNKDWWSIQMCCVQIHVYIYRYIYIYLNTPMRETGRISEWTCFASSAALTHKTHAGSQWLYFQGGDWARLLTGEG